MSGPMLTTKDVSTLTTLSRCTIWRLVKRGTFPAPVALTPGRQAWYSDEVAQWLEARRG